MKPATIHQVLAIVLMTLSAGAVALSDQVEYRPRIGMFWSPADVPSEPMANLARHDIIVLSIQTLDLHWTYAPWPALSQTIDQNSILAARANLLRIRSLNPNAIVCFEVYFFEDIHNHYPPSSPWWLRDEAGKRVQFWPGAYRMDLGRDDYVMHVARRIKAVHKAVPQAGIFIDNVHMEGKQGWLKLLNELRRDCPSLRVMVNAGWKSKDLEWIAPLVNGFQFEDAVSHVEDDDTEAYYARIAALDKLTLEPLMSVNEVYGPRRDTDRMRREYVRTLVYTDMAFLYADSTHGHKHEWYDLWEVDLGEAMEEIRTPTKAKLAARRFANGTAYWLPADASRNISIQLPQPMQRVRDGSIVRKLMLAPGDGEIVVGVE